MDHPQKYYFRDGYKISTIREKSYLRSIIIVKDSFIAS
jgi:hypothetical protein